MRQRQGGFTLVEVLVAIGVATLLVGLVYGAVRIGHRSAAAMNTRVEQAETMRIGWQFLYDALTRARPVQNPVDADDETSFFGTPTALTFVADMPAYVGLGGLMRLSLTIDESSGTRQLVLSRRRFIADEDIESDESVEHAVLVDGLDTVEFAYYGQTERDQPAIWQDEWQGVDTLPNLVNVSIKPTDAVSWPRMTARPLTGSAPLEEEDSPIEGEQATVEEQDIEDESVREDRP